MTMTRKSFYHTLSLMSIVLCGCEPSIPENSAKSCFNATLYQPGNHFTTAWIKDNQQIGIFKTTYSNTEYQGKSATIAKKKLERANKDITLAQKLVVTTDKDNWQYLKWHSIIEVNYNATVVKNTMLEPSAIDFNFIQAGEQRKREYRMKTVQTDNTWAPTLKYDSKLQQTTQFVGMELITTAAGTFNTCHIKLTTNHLDSDKRPSVEDTWYAQSLGIPVKWESQNSDKKTMLVSASIDGKRYNSSKVMKDKYHESQNTDKK